MEHQEIAFAPLLIVVILAFMVPLVLSRVRRIMIPVVVGEIVAGMLVGGSGLGLVEPNVVLTVLADLGFVYLMFLSGLEISVSDVTRREHEAPARGIRRLLANPFVLGLTLFGLALCLSSIAALYLRAEQLVTDPWIMALILSTTSLGVVVPVLKERGLTAGRYGQAILISALVADFATILLISVYVMLKSEGASSDLLLILVLFVAFLATYRLAGLFRDNLPAQALFERLSSATSQLKLRGAFALALTFVALAESLGVEHILGAFLAGVIISLLSGGSHSDLREKLDAVGYSFFIPIFFVMVGVSFELSALRDSSALTLVPLLLCIAYVVKLLPALLYRTKFSWREALAAGVLLSTRLSLIIAASAIGLELGLITDAVNSAVILVAVITCTASPILFSRLVPELAQPRGVLVAGGGTVGRLLAEQFVRNDDGVIVIERDLARVSALRALDLVNLTVIHGDATDPVILESAGIRDIRVVVTTATDDVNLRICEVARIHYGLEHVVSCVNDPATLSRLNALGVRALSPAAATAMILHNLVSRPTIFGLLSDTFDEEGTTIIEVRVGNRAIDGRQLRSLAFPGDALLLVIRRNGERLIPHGVTRLALGDIVTIAGSSSATQMAARMLSDPGATVPSLAPQRSLADTRIADRAGTAAERDGR